MIQFWTRFNTGNGDKLVIEFLSTLEHATSWLHIRGSYV